MTWRDSKTCLYLVGAKTSIELLNFYLLLSATPDIIAREKNVKLTIKQIKQLIKEEPENLLNEGSFENWPEKLQKMYKALWKDMVMDVQKTWEEAIYNRLLSDREEFNQTIKIDPVKNSPEKFFEYQFGDPIGRIIMHLTYSIYNKIAEKEEEEILDLLHSEWTSAADYFSKTEEAREIIKYTRGLVNFAWTVATGELPDGLDKLDELARSSVEGMLQAYGIYESLY